MKEFFMIGVAICAFILFMFGSIGLVTHLMLKTQINEMWLFIPAAIFIICAVILGASGMVVGDMRHQRNMIHIKQSTNTENAGKVEFRIETSEPH